MTVYEIAVTMVCVNILLTICPSTAFLQHTIQILHAYKS